MKTRYICLALLLSAGIKQAAFAQHDAMLYRLAKKKFYNELADSLVKSKSSYNKLYLGILKSAFNQPEASNAILNTISTAGMPDSVRHLYRAAKYDNYLNLFYYKKAARLGDTLVKEDQQFYSANDYDDLKEDVNVWNCVANVAPEKVTKTGDSKVVITQDKLGLKEVPVKIGNSLYGFVFDTGASISVVTESFAKELGVTITSPTRIKTRAIAGNYVPGKMGMLPSLTIGNVTVKNVIFYVFPDSTLTFGTLKINAIVGYPVIKEFGTFTQTKTDITIPASTPAIPGAHHNFIVQQQAPVIYMTAFGKELPFTFDTGDDSITLYKTFYDLFKDKLKGDNKKIGMAGAGASIQVNAFIADSLTMNVNNKQALFNKIPINLDSTPISGDTFYGNVGQALISKFSSMTISFTNAQIDFN